MRYIPMHVARNAQCRPGRNTGETAGGRAIPPSLSAKSHPCPSYMRNEYQIEHSFFNHGDLMLVLHCKLFINFGVFFI